ncbi:unnamed protein product [Moneuplotes crassus]|uniref:Uncharacterized protein n=1 Tax=Euplotes crassus TaxID=5936 RepID=A0AAD1XQ90_EUPCR|nr:unnamed protein product [Moneuplotes crassus]
MSTKMVPYIEGIIKEEPDNGTPKTQEDRRSHDQPSPSNHLELDDSECFNKSKTSKDLNSTKPSKKRNPRRKMTLDEETKKCPKKAGLNKKKTRKTSNQNVQKKFKKLMSGSGDLELEMRLMSSKLRRLNRGCAKKAPVVVKSILKSADSTDLRKCKKQVAFDLEEECFY